MFIVWVYTKQCEYQKTSAHIYLCPRRPHPSTPTHNQFFEDINRWRTASILRILLLIKDKNVHQGYSKESSKKGEPVSTGPLELVQVQWSSASNQLQGACACLSVSLSGPHGPACMTFLCSPPLPISLRVNKPFCQNNMGVTSKNYLYKQKY